MSVKAFLLALTCLSPSAYAGDIVLNDQEIENLGIRTAAPLEAEAVPAIEATATIVIPPANDLFVSSPLPGLLLRQELSAGEPVRAGQVLAEIKSSAFLAQQREFLDALTENLLARRALERDRQMYAEGIISERRLQETESRAAITAAGLREHRQMLQIAGLTAREIHALEKEQVLSNVLHLRAPFDGVVLDRLASTGQQVDETLPVYRIADLSVLWLDINVPREFFDTVKPGMRVQVADSALEWPAVVTTVGSTVDPVTQSVHVRAEIDTPDHGLRPGQFLAVELVEQMDESTWGRVWSVPVSSVARIGEGFSVFVRTADGFAVREVELAGVAAGRHFLRAKFSAGEHIAVTGIAALKAIWLGQADPDS